MDLTPFKRDVDDLLGEFIEIGAVTLAEMKKVWVSRKFTYIYEAMPSSHNLAFFMQALYAHAIGYMVTEGSLSKRLGGLYCLYCLYETQPFVPPFKIYLSLELQKLKILVADAKRNGIEIALAVVKRMLSKNMFLFGHVNANEDSVTAVISGITKQQNTQIRAAHDMLLSNSKIEEHVNMDLSSKLDLEGLKNLSADYAKTKASALQEAGKVVRVEDIEHIAIQEETAGERVAKIAEEWELQRQAYYREIGTDGATCMNNDTNGCNDFENQLELMLEDHSSV
ncbi:uncharacterized protein LOC18427084 isoform X2 [Amborella trichopoda]|uniref:uncharacterized protein LOC18427084 isoform X2 n=1 Tax=Amborella trichopoda TaxID=13333 RepID=UPI0005D30252|nr:uncharacterized protein LOC18427084 isoform X2 [Amborella trichopoda]XP_020518506.1 uncharacterized protein LOC18427084 isoform X2 [Amborella trichopoda]|eukprot:XP_011620706.1 uncharacterized protein LOC18427084 isoform X2 [Amborella trichopoda]